MPSQVLCHDYSALTLSLFNSSPLCIIIHTVPATPDHHRIKNLFVTASPVINRDRFNLERSDKTKE
jgi:hypothetical protein